MPSLLDNTKIHHTLASPTPKNQRFSQLSKQFLILIAIFLLNSCQKTSEQLNKDFLKQYGGEVKEINTRREAQRVQPDSDCKSSPLGCIDDKNRWKDPATIFGIENSITVKSASVDTSRIVMPKPPEEFSPDLKTLMQGQGAQLPENMFQISYNLYNFPKSYGRPTLSFDDINIPKHDAFGVRTELGEKNYQLIGNRTLQKDVDFTKQLSSKSDQEISLELIKQEKQIRRRGNSKINVKEIEEPKAADQKAKDQKAKDQKELIKRTETIDE